MNTYHKREKRRILELSSPQSSGRSKPRVRLTPIRKIRGRMASRLNNKSLEKYDFSEGKIESNRATCSSGNDNTTFSIIQNINILLYYYLENNEIQNIEILVNEDKTIAEFIRFSLNIINEQLRSEKKNIQFNTNQLDKYCIKEVKKNGLPNNDLPIFYPGTSLNNCKEDKLCIVWLGEKNSNFIRNNLQDNNFSYQKKNKIKLHHPTIKKYKKQDIQSFNDSDDDICEIF
jgi:hypothetical protein